PRLSHLLETLRGHEVVRPPFLLAESRFARRVRNGKVEVDAEPFELAPHLVDEGGFPGPGRTGDDEQRPVRVEVTRHSGPARGFARPRFSSLQQGFGCPPSATSIPWC